MTSTTPREVHLPDLIPSYTEQAGIRLRNTPAPLFRVVVLAMLLAAPVRSESALRAARALAPWGTVESVRTADTAELSAALTRSGYWRFHVTKARLLIAAAEYIHQTYAGDLRRLLATAGSADDVRRRLGEIPGVGSAAAAILCRELQAIWPELAPFLDERVLAGAALLGLPTDPLRLAAHVTDEQLPRFAATCVAATLRTASR